MQNILQQIKDDKMLYEKFDKCYIEDETLIIEIKNNKCSVFNHPNNNSLFFICMSDKVYKTNKDNIMVHLHSLMDDSGNLLTIWNIINTNQYHFKYYEISEVNYNYINLSMKYENCSVQNIKINFNNNDVYLIEDKYPDYKLQCFLNASYSVENHIINIINKDIQSKKLSELKNYIHSVKHLITEIKDFTNNVSVPKHVNIVSNINNTRIYYNVPEEFFYFRCKGECYNGKTVEEIIIKYNYVLKNQPVLKYLEKENKSKAILILKTKKDIEKVKELFK